ncbi:MAG: SDR family oxidoreductase [Acidobacteria bacterium]|nr:MAG: SDR family oxidoreductase [Acidobacteriota bacterium]
MSGRAPRRRSVALVTGASTGIGYELTRLLAADGHDLILVARSRDRLAAVAREMTAAHGVGAEALARDLSRQEDVRSLVQELGGAEVDVLVNNAGFGSFGPFANTDLETLLAMIQLNVSAVTHLTRALLPGMLQRRRGRILNVASTAAFQPGPLMAVYYATKAFVLHLSEALAEELRGGPVTVTALCPGPTESEFARRAGMEESRLFRRWGVMDAATVARAGYRAMMRGKRLVVPGWTNRFLACAVRFVPRRLVPGIVRRIQEP